ncbi:MAG: MinD/ParA family protein [Thermodesulfobacteriota bacterium]|nr:MinD/ParA family protein [Thermodesulfobacteriota bacterium]
MKDQAHTLRKILDHGKNISGPRVVSVTSGKGGVGKTSMVVNMAVLLASMGKKVLILDADLGLANIDVMLGLTPKYNIRHVLNGERMIEEILLKGPHDIDIIPASSGIQELVDLSYDQQLSFMNALDYFDGNLDYMIVDTGAGISKNVMYFNAASQRIVVIATPEPTSMTDAYALIKVLRKGYGVKRFSLVINNVQSVPQGTEVAKKLILVCEKFLGDVTLDMLGSIPHDLYISECIRNQKTFVDTYPSGDTTKRLARIVKQMDRSHPSYNAGSLQFFMKRIFFKEVKGQGNAEQRLSGSY